MTTTIRTIHLFGVGAIGSNLAVKLVRQYPELRYVVYDDDIVEERNLRIQEYFAETQRQPKVHALRAVLQRYTRKLDYVPVKTRVTSKPAQPLDNELFIDCFDNTESRRLLKLDAPNVLHVGFSPSYTAEILWDDVYEVPGALPEDAPDICSLHDAVMFIQSVTSRAGLVIADFLETGRRRNVVVTNKETTRYV